MLVLKAIAAIILGYLLGSIPFGLLIVKLFTGKDVRKIESGRTGGTNAMRAAGFWAGFGTAILDMAKSAVSILAARWLAPGQVWVEVLAPVAAVLGHNYSLYLIERDEQGRIRMRGGAGGAPVAGGVAGFWLPSILFVIPIGAAVLYFIGYASVATMSIGLVATLVLIYRAAIGAAPWEWVAFGLISELLLLWALRPNIRRLLNGTERMVGLRARRKRAREQSQGYSSSSNSSSS